MHKRSSLNPHELLHKLLHDRKMLPDAVVSGYMPVLHDDARHTLQS
jgi:hypothetical protein